MAFRKLATIGIVVLALVAFLPAPAWAGDAARARRDLTAAKNNAESGRWDDFGDGMKKVAADMDGLSDAEKKPLLAGMAEIRAVVTKSVEEEVTKRLDKAAKADAGMGKLDIDRANMRLNSDEAKNYADPAAMDKLRARIATMTGTPAPAPVAPTPAAPAGKTPAKAMSGDLATAAARVRLAHNMLEQGSPRIADGMIRQALKLLEPIPETEKAPVMADIVALSAKIDEFDLKARRAEESRRVDEQVGRYVGDAANSIEAGRVGDSDRIDKAANLLATNDVQTNMDAERIQKYQATLDGLRIKLKAHNKAVALERSAPTLKELEQRVAADPFKGVDERGAYDVFTSLKALSDRVRGEFSRVSKDDPEIKAVLDRIAAANAKIEAASGKWSIEKTQADFTAGWKFASQPFAGWESEQLAPDSVKHRRIEGLDKTAQAVSGTVYWLNKDDIRQTLEKYRGNTVITGVAQTARKILDDASAKLNEAFVAVLSDAEREPMPARESDRAQVGYLALDAARLFAGTKYKDPNVARAQALDAKWKAETARLEKEMEETLKTLTAAANAAWPRIEASVGAE